MVGQIVDQSVQEIFLKDQVLSRPQVKLLQLYQVLDHRVSQVDHYIAVHYFELIGGCRVINQEAPISILAPIYHDYMSQMLEYLPRNLLLPEPCNEVKLSGLETIDNSM